MFAEAVKSSSPYKETEKTNPWASVPTPIPLQTHIKNSTEKLEMQKRHHTQRQKTVTAEHILLQTREQRARESLNTMLKKADEKKKMMIYN